MHILLKQLLDRRRKPKPALTPAERNTALKLHLFIKMLQQGKSPSTAQLRACMTVQEIRSYKEHVQQAKHYARDVNAVPKEFNSYTDALKAADFAFNAKRDDSLAETLYERAYEILQEVVSGYALSEVQMYFDRDIHLYHISYTDYLRDMSADELINSAAYSPEPQAAPRLVTSNSKYSQSNTEKLRQAEHDAKIQYLQQVFDSICYTSTAQPKPSSTLKEFIQKINKAELLKESSLPF